MASQQKTVDLIVNQMRFAGEITFRKMFGEYGLYCNSKLIGLVCDDQLFIKPTQAGRAQIGQVVEAPPYPGAKPSFLISAKQIQDAAWLSELVYSVYQELPAPKPKPVKQKSKK
ncbi:MAG: TfoX/Sxy family protein [Anaerolineales bacterium]|nr:TfoX/Sxy family protein [Anaerolineales bacterium]